MKDDLIKRLLEIEMHFRDQERGAQNKTEKRKYIERSCTIGDAILAVEEVEQLRRAWQTIKHSVIDTAQNNAGTDGNEDVYKILMFVAQMMDNQEKEVGENDP